MASLLLLTKLNATPGILDRIKMHVKITNKTGQDCKLLYKKIIHGNVWLSPPQNSLLSNQTADYEFIQTTYGPDAILSYACNPDNYNNTVTFEVSQGLSWIFQEVKPVFNLIESNGLVAISLDSDVKAGFIDIKIKLINSV